MLPDCGRVCFLLHYTGWCAPFDLPALPIKGARWVPRYGSCEYIPGDPSTPDPTCRAACPSGYAPGPSGPLATTCMVNGTWGNIQGSCVGECLFQTQSEGCAWMTARCTWALFCDPDNQGVLCCLHSSTAGACNVRAHVLVRKRRQPGTCASLLPCCCGTYRQQIVGTMHA